MLLPTTKTFKFRLFGSVQLWIDQKPITRFRTYKIRDLLIYLTVKANTPHQRDDLAALLWSDYPDRVARTNLRNTLTHLRKILAPILANDPTFLTTTRQIIQLKINPEVYWSDVYVVEALLAAYQSHTHQGGMLCEACLQQLPQMVALYQGEFLSGLSQTDKALFEDWRLQQQEYYHRQMTQACEVLTKHHFQQGDYAQAEQYVRRQLSLEPWLEEAHQQLMQTLALRGQRAAALAQYETCHQTLAKELGVKPSAETDRLYEQIRTENLSEYAVGQENEKGLPSASADLRPAFNLPPALTPFFGRETELKQLEQLLLDPLYRLITLVGSGGIGKTRLALAAAKQALAHFADGVWFVDLAGLSSGEVQDSEEADTIFVENAIATAIAETLNLTFYESDRPKIQLLSNLRHKDLFLVLDNFDHLLSGTNFIVDLLNNAPQLSLLVTSREQFGLQSEYVMQIEGLAVPNLANEPGTSIDSSRQSHSSVHSYSSVQLFAERADRTRRGFTLNDDNQTDVIRICRFLEGLPLGIELAATWIKVMTCADIARAVEQDLDFLTTSRRDVSTRHRSLRAVFEYSWQMLSEQEHLALSQVSIFRGDFSQEAAGKVTETSPTILTALVDKSLVQLIMPGRYQLHELLRQFAAEKLADLSSQPNLNGLLTQIEDRHALYYLTFIQQRESTLNDRQARVALVEIRDEIKNIRQAWQWAVTYLKVEMIKQSLEALSNFYYLMGLFEEGIMVCEIAANRIRSLVALLAQLEPELQMLLGNLLIKQAFFLSEQIKTDQAILAAQSALDLGRNINSKVIIAAGHLWWGRALWHQGKFEAAQAQLEQSLSYARGQLPQMEAYNLRILSNLYFDQGDYAQARIYDQQALHIYRELNNLREEAAMLSNLGHVAISLGNYAQAKEYLEQALLIRREIHDRQGEAISLEGFGNLYYRLENYELAQQYLETALKIYEQIGDREGIGYVLTYLGNVWLGLGKLETANKSYRRALQVRQEAGQLHLISEDQAGLAQVALRQDKLDQAQVQVEAILDYLEHDTLKGEDLFRVYMTCYQVLKANQDSRAQNFLNTAYQHLQKQAIKIKDEMLRRSFLENVTIHREIVREWQLTSEAL